VNVGEALAILGGRLYDPRFCDRHAGTVRSCTHMPDCSIRSVWRLLQDAVDEVLRGLTLKDLLRSEGEVKAWVNPRAVVLPMATRPS
jgi:DNA-binding IscR family transcriptional regulator